MRSNQLVRLILPLLAGICFVGCSQKGPTADAKKAPAAQEPSLSSSVLPEKEGIYPISKFEKIAESTFAPSSKDPLQQFREEVKVFVATVQSLRAGLAAEIANKPPEVQLRILESDRALEVRAGTFLKNVPSPPNMSGKRLIEYKKGFVKIADVYFAQASKIEQQEAEIGKNLKAPASGK